MSGLPPFKVCPVMFLRALSIREAGGKLAERGKALEDEYFYKKQKELLAELKKNLQNQLEFHKKQVERHKEQLQETSKELSETEEIAKELDCELNEKNHKHKDS